MQIREAKIFNFGKLQNKNISFAPGINVIYGKNEAGKTTLHTFLKAMLFGMEKGRGRTAANSDYNQYEPWHAPSFYSGAMRFSVGQQSFYLERNFYSRERIDYLRNEVDGEELSVACGDLMMLLGGVTRETYENTYDIPQSGAATGTQMVDLLAEYLAKAADGTDGSVSATDAAAALQTRKKELQQEQKKEETAMEADVARLRMEKGFLEEDCRRLRDSVAGFETGKTEGKPEDAEEKRENSTEQGRKKISRNFEDIESGRDSVWQKETEKNANKSEDDFGTRKRIFGGFVICLLLAIALSLSKVYINQTTFTVAETAFIVMAAGFLGISVYLTKSSQKKDNDKTHAGYDQAEKMLADLKDSLQEKETRLYNIEEEITKRQAKTERMRRREEDILALEMAADQILKISKAFYEDTKDEINAEISRLVSLFTAGSYDSVQLDERGHLLVFTEGREVAPEALSRGTLEQIYLALRIAVGNVVAAEEKLPVILDDAFAMYDEERLTEVLKVLSGLENQILIFTCQKREEELLKREGIAYYRVQLY